MPEIIYNSYIPSELYCLTAPKHLQNVILRDTRRLLHPDNITLDSLCLNVEPWITRTCILLTCKNTCRNTKQSTLTAVSQTEDSYDKALRITVTKFLEDSSQLIQS